MGGKEVRQHSFKHLPWLDLHAAEFCPGVPKGHSKMIKNLVARKTHVEKDDVTETDCFLSFTLCAIVTTSRAS
jgi:hypothetical protein